MILKNKESLLFLLASAIVAYVLHKIFFYVFKINQDVFYYSLEKLYGIFSILSSIIILILLKIKERNFDQVGMSFLLLTSIKIIFYFLLLKSILKNSSIEVSTEKMNFFAMFIVFLTIETVITIRLLNEKK